MICSKEYIQNTKAALELVHYMPTLQVDYIIQQLQGTVYPYAAFYLISNVPHWTFDATMENSIVQFSIFDDDSNVSDIGDLYKELTDLYDWTDLTLDNYSSVFLKRESSNLLKNEDVWQYVISYRTEIQKT